MWHTVTTSCLNKSYTYRRSVLLAFRSWVNEFRILIYRFCKFCVVASFFLSSSILGRYPSQKFPSFLRRLQCMPPRIRKNVAFIDWSVVCGLFALWCKLTRLDKIPLNKNSLNLYNAYQLHTHDRLSVKFIRRYSICVVRYSICVVREMLGAYVSDITAIDCEVINKDRTESNSTGPYVSVFKFTTVVTHCSGNLSNLPVKQFCVN
jgi:hypothetical protein